MLKNVDPNKGQRERISVKEVKQVIFMCLFSLWIVSVSATESDTLMI